MRDSRGSGRFDLYRMLGCALLCGWLVACASEATLPIPPELEQLDPLVRVHLEEQIAPAREERSAQTLTALALAYLANSFPLQADDVFAQVARLTPNDPLPQFYRALAQGQAGRHDAARETLAETVARWPDFSPAWERLAGHLLEAGALEDAARAFERVIEREPNEPAGYLGLAETQLQQGDPRTAIETLATLRPEGAALPQRKLLKGRCLRALGRLEEAVFLIEGSRGARQIHLPDAWAVRLALHVRDLRRLVERATQMIQVRQAAGAIALLEEIRAVHPDNYEVAVNLGVAYLRGGRSADGQTLLDSVNATHPDRFEGHLNLAAVHLERGALDVALGEAERAVELAPGVAQAHRTLAKVCERQKRYPEALAAFDAAAAVAPYDAILQVEVAKAALRARDPVRAEEACRRVAALEPDSITGPLCLGEALRRQQRLEEAGEALAAARRMEPDHPDVAKLAARLEQ